MKEERGEGEEWEGQGGANLPLFTSEQGWHPLVPMHLRGSPLWGAFALWVSGAPCSLILRSGALAPISPFSTYLSRMPAVV